MPGTLLSPTDLGVPQGSSARGPLPGSPTRRWTNICSLLFCYFVHSLRTNNKITLNKRFATIVWRRELVFCSVIICYLFAMTEQITKTNRHFCYLFFVQICSNKFAQLNLFEQTHSNEFTQLNVSEHICAPPCAGLRQSPSFSFPGYHPYITIPPRVHHELAFTTFGSMPATCWKL